MALLRLRSPLIGQLHLKGKKNGDNLTLIASRHQLFLALLNFTGDSGFNDFKAVRRRIAKLRSTDLDRDTVQLLYVPNRLMSRICYSLRCQPLIF